MRQSRVADFDLPSDRVWLNAAHQGPLPRVAVRAALAAVEDKASPHRISDESFTEVPQRLRAAFARLIGGKPSDVVLGNSASYGLNVLVRGLAWQAGDEVLLPEGEFPASVFPWKLLETRGVSVRFMPCEHPGAPTAGEVASQLTDRTRVFCASWVNSFSGWAIDVEAVGEACRRSGTWFILNASQALGVRRIDVSHAPVDGVTTCGWKWLVGPYGAGAAWFSRRLSETLGPSHCYWLPHVWGRGGDLKHYVMRTDLGVQSHDVFATANFFNYAPWTAAIEYLLAIGVSEIEPFCQKLVDRLLDRIDRERFTVHSPLTGSARSAIVVIGPRAHDAPALHRALLRAGIGVSLREGALRLSPHVYNTELEMEHVATVLNTFGDR